MNRLYYLNGKLVYITDIIKYLTDLLATDGDTTKWEAFGITFEDMPFEEYIDKVLFKDKKGE
jgi:hypothetical protein